MRIWEIDDSKPMPSDLVREQDFILRLRRLQRLGAPHLIVNLILTAAPELHKNPRARDAVGDRLKDFARITGGAASEMSNGDLFIIWEETGDAQLLAARLASVVRPDAKPGEADPDFIKIYHLPDDYTALRERANAYVEIVRAAASGAATSVQALKSQAANGPLTAWSVDQIGQVLPDIDLGRYARTQPIYRYQADGGWSPVAEEYFVGFEDLRRDLFPKVDLITPEHLFLALCEKLDQRLLEGLTLDPKPILGRPMHLNVAVNTVAGTAFAQFAKAVPHDKRHLITLELHRGDLLQDFTRTLGAIEVLKQEGFRVAFDSVTPDMAPYIDLAAFAVDLIKINVSRDRAALLREPKILQALSRIPAARLAFFRCDNEQALTAGLALGVGLFQGWLIDDAVAGHPHKA